MQKILGHLLVFFGFWLLLSGQWTSWFISLGLISSALVLFVLMRMQLLAHSRLCTLGFYIRLLRYLPWLAQRVLVANCRIAWYVLTPNPKLSPGFLRFETSPKPSLAQAILANSITLTSGTLVCAVAENTFEVHIIHRHPLNEKELTLFDEHTTAL